MIIYLLIFFYNPTKFLIRSSSTILFFICIFIIILFYFLGNYIYYRMETSKNSININYSDYDKYSFKIFRCPSSFINLSYEEGSVRLNRYQITFNVINSVLKEKQVEYFDKFPAIQLKNN